MALATLSSSRALAYLSERGEDALYAVKDALGGSGSMQYLDIGEDKLALVQKQLESTHDEERLDGMKRVVALISKGHDATRFLASVFKLSSTTSLEVRKLVYVVVLRYAPSHPDLALLSINSFQRDLTDPNPLIRGMALRTLSGIRLKAVSAIVLLAIAKAARDVHPYVRRIAAFALSKCYHLDHGQCDALIEHLKVFLQDRSPLVLGPAVSAFAELCLDNWDLLHGPFRKLCHALADMDEWSQPRCANILVRYARRNLPQPSTTGPLDEDMKLLLKSLEVLLHHMNPAVVLAGVHALMALQPDQVGLLVPSLARLLRETPDIAYVAATEFLRLSKENADVLAPYIPLFYVRAADPEYLALVKLRLLGACATASSASSVAQELAVYSRAHSTATAEASLDALGHLATRFAGVRSACLSALMSVAQDPTAPPVVLSRAVQVIQTLLRNSSLDTTGRMVARLAIRLFVPLATYGRTAGSKRVHIFKDPDARAAILWMLGHYSSAPVAGGTLHTVMVPDVLRCLVAHWNKEAPKVQCQALALMAKAFVLLDSESDATLSAALTFLHYEMLSLASRSDSSDVRERARFYAGLTRGLRDSSEELDAAPNEEMREYLKAHRAQDCVRLPGVRLRREQVWHVLFERDEGAEVSPSQLAFAYSKPSGDAPGMGLLLDNLHLEGESQLRWPAWRDPSELPPAILRAPTVEAMAAEAKPRTWLDEQRSFSSDTFHAMNSKPMKQERIVLEPRTRDLPARTGQAKARHEDLDSFLNADSEEEEAAVGSTYATGTASDDDEYDDEETSLSSLSDDDL